MVLKILKTIATSGFLIAIQRTKFVFSRGLRPHTTWGAYSDPPDLIDGL